MIDTAPSAKRIAITACGVISGCHAGTRCWVQGPPQGRRGLSPAAEPPFAAGAAIGSSYSSSTTGSAGGSSGRSSSAAAIFVREHRATAPPVWKTAFGAAPPFATRLGGASPRALAPF